LRCSDRSYYVGHTDEIERRLAEHETGATSGYTAARRPVQLVWFQEFLTREEAKAAEAQIKKWSRRKKEALIGGRMKELSAAARKDWVSYRQRRAG
jgi:predicted GIY-YIG superfamily endonuclease